MKDLTAIILAGGLGTRLRSVVSDRPKVLAEINGLPFLAYLLSDLQLSGVKQVIIAIGYMGFMIREYFGSRFGNMNILYSEEKYPLGTGGALSLAAKGISTENVLVLNGDSYFGLSYRDFYKAHKEKKSNFTIALTKVENVGRYGRVIFDENGKVTGFEEKSKRNSPGYINAGVYLTTRNFLLSIPAAKSISLEREVLPELIGNEFFTYKAEGFFIDIGTPESYAQASRIFENKQLNQNDY